MVRYWLNSPDLGEKVVLKESPFAFRKKQKPFKRCIPSESTNGMSSKYCVNLLLSNVEANAGSNNLAALKKRYAFAIADVATREAMYSNAGLILAMVSLINPFLKAILSNGAGAFTAGFIACTSRDRIAKRCLLSFAKKAGP